MNKRRFEHIQRSMRNGNPWSIETQLNAADKGYLMLLSAVYEQAIEELRRTRSLTGGAALFLQKDPYGYLSDDLKKTIFEGVQNESKRNL